MNTYMLVFSTQINLHATITITLILLQKIGAYLQTFPPHFCGFLPLNPFSAMELIYKQCVLSLKWLYVKDTLCNEAFHTIRATQSAPRDTSFWKLCLCFHFYIVFEVQNFLLNAWHNLFITPYTPYTYHTK